MASGMKCDTIIVPPADCGGHGTLVPAECTCTCNQGYFNDFTVGVRGGTTAAAHVHRA